MKQETKDLLMYIGILFALVMMCCIASAKAFGQEIQREGNNFVVINTLQQQNDIQTIYTYTIKDVVYPIWITKNGRCYIVRISKNGNQYKQYLNKEICLVICKELNINYVE